MTPAECTVIVVAGGASRRFGANKLAAPFAGRTLLDTVVRGVAATWPSAPIICVGSEQPLSVSVRWTREDPPGGGPAAAVCAGLPLAATEFIAVVGGDMPYAGAALAELMAAARTGDGAIAETADGRRQPLLAVVRTDRLRMTRPAEADGIPMKALWNPLQLHAVAIDSSQAADVDTPADLDRLTKENS